MWKLLIFSFIYLCFINLSNGAETNATKYTTKYDNIDINQVLHNDRLLKNYVYCLLDKGPCTSDGMELKNNMPDAISSNCSKCSEAQKEKSETMINYLIDNKMEYWEPLQEKYDPSGSYRTQYLKNKNTESK